MTFADVAGYEVTVSHASIPASIEWSKADGGDLTHSSQKFRATARGKKQVLAGDSERDNITTTCYCDPVAHAAFLADLDAGTIFEGTTISVVYLDKSGVPKGSPRQFTGCSIAKAPGVSADANSEDMFEVVIEWAAS